MARWVELANSMRRSRPRYLLALAVNTITLQGSIGVSWMPLMRLAEPFRNRLELRTFMTSTRVRSKSIRSRVFFRLKS